MVDLAGPLALERFKIEVLPYLPHSSAGDEELSEEEYQRQLAVARSELPYFARFILDYKPGQGPINR